MLYKADNARTLDNSRMRGNSAMYDYSQMYDSSEMRGRSMLSHTAVIRAAHTVRNQWLFCSIMTLNRSDGYTFAYWPNNDGEWMVTAGCRFFTMDDALKHWKETRKGTPLGEETFVILDALWQWRDRVGQVLWDNRPEKPGR